MAIAYDTWWNTRNRKSYVFNPSNPNIKPKIISDRNYQDTYSDPGSFLRSRNEFNRSVLKMHYGNIFLRGQGFSPSGQFPL